MSIDRLRHDLVRSMFIFILRQEHPECTRVSFFISLEFVSLRPNAFYYHSCIALCTYIIDRVNCVTITVKCMLLHPLTVYTVVTVVIS